MVDTKEVVVLLHCRPKLEDILQQADNGKFTGFLISGLLYQIAAPMGKPSKHTSKPG